MSEPFTSPTPWTHRDTGGAETVIDRYGRTVAILARGMEPGNGAVISAAPDLREALAEIADMTPELAEANAADTARAALLKVDR